MVHKVTKDLKVIKDLQVL
jgi:hypothetical protein